MGQKSRVAGVVLAVFSLVFLGLSLYFRNSIFFQIDSLVCLLAAIAVFLRGERSAMQIRIVNRMLNSSNQALNEMTLISFGDSAGFNYLPLGEKLTDVVVATSAQKLQHATLETSTNGQSTIGTLASSERQANLVPPGRSLAELYQRELGLVLSADLLVQSLSTIICDRFELGTSLAVTQAPDGSTVEIKISQPAVRQTCTPTSSGGMLGCSISSMLAVLFCHATKRPVRVERCDFDESKSELRIVLSFPTESRE